jgi:branched-chain amino acid aminotransferase
VKIVAVWINGVIYPDDQARISVFDHGLVTGDGVFETVKVTDGTPFALSRHIARLARSADGLGLGGLDPDRIRTGVGEVIARSPALARARLRITVTAGPSPLSSVRGSEGLTVIVAMSKIPPPAPFCDVVMAPWPRNERDVLAGLKTTSYAGNVRALGYATGQGAGEAIFANLAGDLCEGTGTNVFVVSGGRIRTPPLSSGCLAGVTRDLVLEWCEADEERLPAAALSAAEEAFLTGTTRDVQPVRLVDGMPLPACPGPATRKAAQIFAECAAKWPDP